MTDICLVLEGTYPYKTGGVAAWVDALVNGLSELTFCVAHLYYGERPREKRYRVPSNIRSVVDISLNAPEHGTPLTIGLDTLLDQVPVARMYHPLSTGFAGYLGTALKRRRRAPMLLTEHGLYWREAELGIGELECGFKIVETEAGPLALGRTWESWSETFRSLALDAYEAADAITTVCDFNRRSQIALGASERKARVIPNGVAIDRQISAYTTRTGAAHIALVGRVSPLKDITTFIRACAVAQTTMPESRWSVIGPTHHDPAYYAECVRLADSLGLKKFSFTGEADVHALYPSIDVAVLTSASEAQPLALLEAMSYGIPVVATDVGGVSEIVAPAGFAHAGILCPPADHAACARAVMSLLADRPLYEACSQAGRAIVESTHSLEAMIGTYRQLYGTLLSN